MLLGQPGEGGAHLLDPLGPEAEGEWVLVCRAEVLCFLGILKGNGFAGFFGAHRATRGQVPLHRVAQAPAREGQVDGAAWFSDRLRAFRERRPHPHSAGVLYDKRRGGKTFLATLLLICFLIDCPTVDGQKTEGVLVTQSIQARDEIEQQIRDILPEDWFTFSEMPKRQFRFAHGAKLTCRTATDPESTRAGRIDIALINEAALMPEKVFKIVGRGLQDKAGVALLTTNKPESKKGGWVARLWEGAEMDSREGREPAVALLRCPEELNPYADKGAKASILRMLDYARDPDDGDGSDDTGLVAEFGDTVMHGIWDDAQHIRPLPDDLDDVTEEITRRLHGRPYPFVIGTDFGETQTATVFKFLAPGGNLAAAQMWALNCIVLTGGDGDESDLSDAVVATGIPQRGALWIGDCSGAFKSRDLSHDLLSFVVLRRCGWEVCGPTIKKTARGSFPKNPSIFESTQRLRKMVADGRLFVTLQARALSTSLRKCEALRDRYGNSVPRTQTAYSHPLLALLRGQELDGLAQEGSQLRQQGVSGVPCEQPRGPDVAADQDAQFF